MATAGTAIRSFLQLMRMPLGYDPANVMKVGIQLHTQDTGEWSGIQSRDARIAYIEQIQEKIASLPGVSAVAASEDATPPYTGADAEKPFEIDGTGDREQTQARVILGASMNGCRGRPLWWKHSESWGRQTSRNELSYG